MGKHSTRRAELYRIAHRGGLKGAAADEWVRNRLHPPKPKPEATPALFGSWLAREAIAAQKGK